MKRIILLVCLILLAQTVVAVTYELNNTSFLKGETLEITGVCQQNQTVPIEALNEGKLVFREDVFCPKGELFFNHKFSFLDPSGTLKLNVAGDITEIVLGPTRESKFLVIKFSSPTIRLQRTEDINVVVLVTDAGVPVTDANILTWDTQGKKHQMIHKGQGNYITSFSLPYDMPLGVWNLTVVAEKRPVGGGEEIHRTIVDKAPIEITFIEPKVTSYSLDDVIPIKVKATYLYEKPIVEPVLTASIGGELFSLRQDDELTYSAEFTPTEEFEGAQVLVVRANDAAENITEKTAELVIIKGFAWYAKFFFWPVVILLIVLAAAFLFLKSKKTTIDKKSQLQRKKKELDKSLKRIQEKYYGGEMDKKIFREEYARLSKEAGEVKEELAIMKKKKVIKKKRVKKTSSKRS
jgi:hypothetical protein